MKDVRRFQGVKGDCLRRTLNFNCLDLIAPVENLIRADVRSLEDTRRGPCRKNTCEAVARSLKIKVNGSVARTQVRVEAFQCRPSAGRRSRRRCIRRGKGRRTSPVTAVENHTLFPADEAFKSSFQALRIPKRTNGRASVQCSSAWHMRAAFSCLWSLSMSPLEAGCRAIVRVREDPLRVARVLKIRGSKCLPWSDVICWGQPK